MKNLIIAIILIFAGLNEVQSQGITVKELSGTSDDTYHLFSQNLNVFLYLTPYAATTNEYNVRLSFTPGGGADETGIVTYDGNDYVIDRSYGDALYRTFQEANSGTCVVLNASRENVSGAVFDVPQHFISFALAGWNYLGVDTVVSPDNRFSATLLARPETFIVSIAGSGSANTNSRIMTGQDTVLREWRNTPAVPGS